MEEIWKDIEGYEGLYQISDMGQVKALAREWFVNGGRKSHPEQIMSLSKHPQGYRGINLFKDGVLKHQRVHRLVAKAFIPNPENKKEVNHKFGIKDDNRATELEWATPSENVRHSFLKGLRVAKSGEDSHRSKLTEEKVRKIRELHREKLNMKEISHQLSIGYYSVFDVLSGRTWSQVV